MVSSASQSGAEGSARSASTRHKRRCAPILSQPVVAPPCSMPRSLYPRCTPRRTPRCTPRSLYPRLLSSPAELRGMRKYGCALRMCAALSIHAHPTSMGRTSVLPPLSKLSDPQQSAPGVLSACMQVNDLFDYLDVDSRQKLQARRPTLARSSSPPLTYSSDISFLMAPDCALIAPIVCSSMSSSISLIASRRSRGGRRRSSHSPRCGQPLPYPLPPERSSTQSASLLRPTPHSAPRSAPRPPEPFSSKQPPPHPSIDGESC